MTSYFKITAYNSQALYVWDAETDADRYVDHLNRNRDVNHYAVEVIPECDWDKYDGRDDVMSMEEPGWDDFMDSEA